MKLTKHSRRGLVFLLGDDESARTQTQYEAVTAAKFVTGLSPLVTLHK